ncbi:MAG: PAS domain S-box protein [Deltaproteobacteria bacterium]|nr:PAS domain S-box protein [Deltaproteobacteria bacterium]
MAEEFDFFSNILKYIDGFFYRCRNDEFWTMTYISSGFDQITGYKKENIIGNTLFSYEDLIFPDDRQYVRNVVEKHLEDRTIFKLRYRLLKKNGSAIWVEENGSGLFSETGELLFIEGVVSNIHELKISEMERDNAVASQSLLFENSMSGIAFCKILLDDNFDIADFIIYQANNEFRALFQENKPVKGESFTSIIPELLEKPFFKQFCSVVENNDRIKFETYLYSIRKWIEITSYRLIEEKIAILFKDISNERNKDRMIHESEERFRGIFENAPLGMFLSTIEGRFIKVNKALSEMLGYLSPQEVVNSVKSISEDLYLNPLDRTKILTEQLNTSTMSHYVNEYKKADGSVFSANLYLKKIMDKDSKIYLLGIVEDITTKLKIKEEKEKLESQVIQAQKMEGVGRLAGGLAHDLNNLLVPILGFSELLIDDCNETQKDALNEIRSAAFSSRELVKRLLVFSRSHQILKSEIDFVSLIKNFEKLIRGSIRENIELDISTEIEEGWISADKTQLEQVVLNLTVNSQDAIKGHGKISIKTYTEVISEDNPLYSVLNKGTYLCCDFTDNGSGIPPDILKNIFVPFFTTKSPDSGTGLGLSTVYGIIHQHHGHITVESEIDTGTTFKVMLPVIDKPSVDEKSSPSSKELFLAHGETILIVEDDQNVLNLTRNILKRFKYNVLTATHKEEAMEKLIHNEVNLMVTDIVMPGIHGPELYRYAKELNIDLKVLYMSGYDENYIQKSFPEINDDNFINKPFSINDFGEKVNRILKNQD